MSEPVEHSIAQWALLGRWPTVPPGDESSSCATAKGPQATQSQPTKHAAAAILSSAFQRINDGRNVMFHHAFVSACIACAETVRVKRPADFGAGFACDLRGHFRIERVFQEDRFHMLLFDI